MVRKLDGLQPARVLYYFEMISSIPRRSGNEKELSNYFVAFAKEHGYDYYQDDAMNVVVKKPATLGYEHIPGVIIQGHLDMVCEKNKNIAHDFEKQGIDLVVDGDFLKANGTTLGADNGIAVAYALALLEAQDIEHPALEVIMTTDEEVGLTGAMKFDKSKLNGHYFINLDSEEEGELTVGCAGGCHAKIELPIVYSKLTYQEPLVKKITVTNLKGGHSGVDIMNFRANANRLMGRILSHLYDAFDMRIIDVHGGNKDNVITRETEAIIIIEDEQLSLFNDMFKKVARDIKNEHSTSEPQIEILEQTLSFDDSYQVVSKDTTEKIIFMMINLPNGVQTMSADLIGIPESSLNVGKVATENGKVEFLFAIRSSVRTLKYHIVNQLEWYSRLLGAIFEQTSDYPEWPFKKDSLLLDKAKDLYEKMYGERPIVKAIHAGLEPGVFLEKMKEIDAISFGPNMWDVHSPDERLSLASTERTWEFLKALLKSLKDK